MSRTKYCPHCASRLEKAEIGGRSRLACSADSCNYVFWDNPVPVVAAILERRDGVVLARNKGWPSMAKSRTSWGCIRTHS